MKQVVIIEPDGRNTQVLERTLLSLNDQLKIYSFTDVKEFYQALKISMQPTSAQPEELEKMQQSYPLFDFKKIVLFIPDLRSSEMVPLDLWKKLMSQIEELSKKTEAPLVPRLVFTAHEDSDLSLTPFFDEKVLTIISKPFDDLLVKQFLQVALDKEGPIKTDHLFTLEKEGKVELVKDIEVERLTELGFSTVSTREIEVGKKARYFGTPFEYEKGNSVYAYCYACNKHPDMPDKFRCSFSYFGVSTTQVQAIRKKIISHEDSIPVAFEDNEKPDFKTNVLLLIKDPMVGEDAQVKLNEKFDNISIKLIDKYSDLLTIVGSAPSEDDEDIPPLFEEHEKIEITFRNELTDILQVELFRGDKSNPVEEILQTSIKSIKSDKDFFNARLKKVDQLKFENIGIEKKLGAPRTVEFKMSDHKATYIKLMEVRPSQTTSGAHILTLKELTEDEQRAFLDEKYGKLKKFDLIFVDDSFCKKEVYPSLRQLLSGVVAKDEKIVLLSSKPVNDYDRIDEVQYFDDSLPVPLDLYYFSRKLKMHKETLNFKNPEDASRNALLLNKSIKTALPATIKSVSESHLSLIYHRALKKGDHRRFILWIPGEVNFPEIDASMLHAEKFEGKSFICDFLFTAVNDSQVKFIRRWIKLTYVQSKK